MNLEPRPVREFVIESKRLSIALVASDLDKPADEATEAIKSFLFTINSLICLFLYKILFLYKFRQ